MLAKCSRPALQRLAEWAARNGADDLVVGLVETAETFLDLAVIAKDGTAVTSASARSTFSETSE